MKESTDRIFEILIVEDNPGDLELMKEVWEECSLSFNVTVARHGVEATEMLFKLGAYSDTPVPDLILLDWNLPRKSGQEVLSEIKTDRHLRTIPVIVFTTSDQERDIAQAYYFNANCYITKPVGLDKYIDVIKSMGHFWMATVRLPAAHRQEMEI